MKPPATTTVLIRELGGDDASDPVRQFLRRAIFERVLPGWIRKLLGQADRGTELTRWQQQQIDFYVIAILALLNRIEHGDEPVVSGSHARKNVNERRRAELCRPPHQAARAMPLDNPDMLPADSLEPGEVCAASELAELLRTSLTPGQRRIFAALLAGRTKAEVRLELRLGRRIFDRELGQIRRALESVCPDWEKLHAGYGPAFAANVYRILAADGDLDTGSQEGTL